MRRTGFDNKTRAQMPVAQHAGSFYDGSRQDGQDERGSMSGSDDGSYAPYHEAVKGEPELEDDHSALTSQTLNTDGTPKRPMNAFMIFARRRRPQVSAENQAMRTGEISKILSKEWNAMQAAEKQFYQDQARQLKDTFNTKYPDYVYRRRPNNSRRKRKPDAAEVLSDKPSPSDDVGLEDVGDSLTDAEDLKVPDNMSDIHRSRPSQDVHTYLDQTKFRPSTRISPYAYPVHENSLRSSAAHENRRPYESPNGANRILHDSPSAPVNHSYSYMPIQGQSQQQTQAIPIYGQSPINSDPSWSLSARPSSWLGPSHQSDRSFASPATAKVQRASTSPTWQRSSRHANVTASSAPVNLSTLNSPFFPLDSTQESLTSSSHSQSIPPLSYTSSSMQPQLLVERDLDNAELSMPPSLSHQTQPFHSNAGREGIMYGHHQTGTLPLISNYSHSLPSQFSTNSGIGGTQYWVRE